MLVCAFSTLATLAMTFSAPPTLGTLVPDDHRSPQFAPVAVKGVLVQTADIPMATDS
ncbi:hypothetical protein Aph01nite_29270 [Acrocarpospora phusangensis]|uniref:Uncharacterized protein n=1 Tax=Acrocarpospora phusangensis TaxID=1070424 RepID=A0A919UNL1_9ACTN|nr:hypothetical protein Aph01nite_29270 [Acrocarpospora phusangensis]